MTEQAREFYDKVNELVADGKYTSYAKAAESIGGTGSRYYTLRYDINKKSGYKKSTKTASVPRIRTAKVVDLPQSVDIPREQMMLLIGSPKVVTKFIKENWG